MTLPSHREKRRFVEEMFDQIAPRYDLVNRIMTFGVDSRWRRRAVHALGVGPGARVLDLGCGTGDLVAEVAKTGAEVVGVDISARMLDVGRCRLPRGGFVRGDAAKLPFASHSFDALVSGFALRNFTSIPEILVEAARVLKPGGRLAILEVNVPRSPLLRLGFDLYFRRLVPRLGGLLSRGYAYRYLAASTVYLPSFPNFREDLESAGFGTARQVLLLAGAAQLLTAVREEPSRRHAGREISG